MRPSMQYALLLVFATLFVLAGCASSQRSTRAASGTWTYTVYGTPEGDVNGELRLVASDDALAGEFTSELARRPAPLKDVRLDGQSLAFSASVDIDGDLIETATSATLNDDSMEGTMEIAGVGSYRFTATRAGS